MMLDARFAASATVCSNFVPPRVAVCVVGEEVAPVDAIFRSIRANVLSALGSNRTSTFLALAYARSHLATRAQHADSVVHEAAERWLRPTSSSSPPLGGSAADTTHDDASLCHSRRDDALRRGRRDCHTQLIAHEQREGVAFDSVLVIPADSLWLTPLWPFCLHPHADASATSHGRITFARNRHLGEVWWLARGSAEVALTLAAEAPPTVSTALSTASSPRSAVQSHQRRCQHSAAKVLGRQVGAGSGAAVNDGGGGGSSMPPTEGLAITSTADSRDNDENDGQPSAPGMPLAAEISNDLEWLVQARRAAADFDSVTDHSLMGAVRVFASTGRVDCRAWDTVVALRWSRALTTLRPPPCPSSIAAHQDASAVRHADAPAAAKQLRFEAGGGSESKLSMSDGEAAAWAAAQLTCAGTSPGAPGAPGVTAGDGTAGSPAAVASVAVHPRASATTAPEGRAPSIRAPQLALCIGGLARTFAHAVVYRSIRGHLVAPLGVDATVFAHLRLSDRRGMTGAHGKDFSGVVPATQADVERALAYLGARAENVALLSEHALVAPPDCRGAGGVYDWDRESPGSPRPGSPPGSSPPSGSAKCSGYGLPCSQHVVDGMLVTRGALYALMVSHERRHAMRFDQVLLVRPDVVALLPSLPWCLLAHDTARKNQDWLEWMPRGLAKAALHMPHADYYACRTPNFSLFERGYAERAAMRGTHLVQDDTLRVIAIVRDNRPNFPHKKDCNELSIGFQAVRKPLNWRESSAPAVHPSERTQPSKEAASPSGLAARLIAQASPALRHCTRCPLDACASLTFANRANQPPRE